MEAKNADNQEIERNNCEDEQDYGKLLVVIISTIVISIAFIIITSGTINSLESIFDNSKEVEAKKALTTQLRKLSAEFNTKAPIHINDDAIITSVSVDEPAIFTIKILMPNMTSKDVIRNDVAINLKKVFTGMACNNEVIRSGFTRGASSRFVMTTIDGYDIDSGIINSSSCN